MEASIDVQASVFERFRLRRLILFGAPNFYCETEPERVPCHHARHRASSESVSESGEIAHADDFVSLRIASKAWYRMP